MVEDFLRSFNILQELELENALAETLRLFDLLSGGSLSRIDSSLLEISEIDLEKIAELRKQGLPMEYIIGKAVFMGFALYCTPDTLIPRNDTELLVNSTLGLLRKLKKNNQKLIVMELGTGCGNIAIALAMNHPNVKILASDICPKAVAVAQKNIVEYGLENRITLSCGDLFAPFNINELREAIDIVVCNPPYIPTGSIKKLDSSIIDHEPVLALDAGAYGINIIRKLIAGAVPFLKNSAALIFEIGAGQNMLVDMLLKKSGAYKNVRHISDGDEVRVISAEKK